MTRLPRLLVTLIMLNTLSGPTYAEAPPPSTGRIALALDRLGVVGTVLYVAAHPDDENTRLLAWLANAKGLRAVYVSLTRGDGGQNLVGSELGPLLGLIRTHELLAARAVDGAEQYFTRAVDFGYSKSAEETLRIWGKDEVLGDLVRVVRATRPDVIVARFSIDPPNHGHHTASAMLAREAFVAAADPARFTDSGAAHQALRLFENKSAWRFKEGEDLSRYLSLDVGGYSPELGRSYSEIAADSRTMHKSQGFGSAPALGPQLEYFEPVLADQWPAAGRADTKDPLAAIDFTWARFPGTSKLIKTLAAAKKAFDPAHPEALLPALFKVHAVLTALPDTNPWKIVKRAELEALMLDCAGIALDARAKTPIAIPGEPFTITATAVARMPIDKKIDAKVSVIMPDDTTAGPRALDYNVVDSRNETSSPEGAYSTPFWLAEPHPPGMFAPMPAAMGIRPLGLPLMLVDFIVALGPVAIRQARSVRHAWVDPVHGERFRPVELLPRVTLTPSAPVRMFPGPAPRPIEVRVRAHGGPRKGDVQLVAPPGWKVSPATVPYDLVAEGEATITFEVTPDAAPAELTLSTTIGGGVEDRAEATIDHLHVPKTTILSRASVRGIPFALKTGGTRIGYIAGAGDEVAASLAQVGYDVITLDPKVLDRLDLGSFDAVIAGIRAYNVAPELRHAHAALMRYVAAGGTYVVQYVTSNRQRALGDMPIGPAPFSIDQGRVTDEGAELVALDPKHPALTTPNAIGPDDYKGWVQERGLYFAETWDPSYTPLFRANDPGDKPLDGAAIVHRHGKGAFVYTGLAFFRQLPEGVAGAYRLFANLLALGERASAKRSPKANK